MAVSIHPAPPADHLVPPHGLAGPPPVRHPQPAPLPPLKKRRHKQLNTTEICSETKHMITHKDWILICFNRTITSTWLYYQGETASTCICWCALLQKTYLSRDKNCPDQFPGGVTDWPVRLRRKGPPLADRQTGHFLHRVPGTAAPPPAACWSSSPAPSPLLPVPTLMCSPKHTKTTWLLVPSSWLTSE